MRKPSSLPGVAVLFALCTASASLHGQALVHDRIQPASRSAARATMARNVAPRALHAIDLGTAPADMPVQAITLRFSLTPAQQQALTQLESAQQNPSSPLFRHWLTPEQYGAQFGLSANDLASVTAWLASQGFADVQVARSHTFVTFSGTAAQVDAAFGTTLHNLQAEGENHFANLTDPTIPTAFAPVVASVTGLDDFRPRPRVKVRTVSAPNPQYTSSISGNTFLAPGDLYTIYNTAPLLNASINGTGITIAVMGQTDIALSDIAAFRSASGLAANAPTVKVYGTDPGIHTADLGEASLDVEWSGAMAPAATILFVNSTNVISGSLTNAIDNNVAPILSISYGDCETGFGSSTSLNSYNQLFLQANVQGQTILGPAGDTGATDCDYGNISGVASGGLAVDFPASSPYVTGVGGSEFNEAGGTYFAPTNGAFQGSALSYIPEMVWSDTAANAAAGAPGLAAGGGGASAFFTKPTFQAGTGVPNDLSRDVPDLSLTASADHDGYLVCVSGSCTNGFRNANNNLDVVGGTSASTPSFAGIMALLEQKIQARVGNANPVIYGLANSTYYASVFHDIIVGSNASACTVGSPNCPSGGPIGFNATVGYDLATGWGSVNAANMVADWLLVAPMGGSTTPTSAGNPSTTTAVSSAPSVQAGTNLTVKITVASAAASLTTIPTGLVQVVVDGVALGSPATLAGGSTTLTVPTSSLGSGGHTATAVYAGDSVYAGSRGTFFLDVVSATLPDFALTPALPSLTVNPGANSPGLTFTLTPVNGFTGAITLSAIETTNTLAGNYTFSVDPVILNGTAAGTTVFNLQAFQPALQTGSGKLKFGPAATARNHPSLPPWKLAGTGIALAGLCLVVFPHRRRRSWSALLVALTAASLLSVSGCSDNGAPSNINSAPGTYTLIVTATNGSATVAATATHNAQVTLTIP